MDDVEIELRRALHDSTRELSATPDPVIAVRAGMRRRARRRVAGGAAAAAMTAFAIVVGTTQVGGRDEGPADPASPVPATSVPAVVSTPSQTQAALPTAAVSPPAPGSAAVSAPVPSASANSVNSLSSVTIVEFSAVDASFVGPNTGWAFGTARCDGEACTALLKTSDGGKTWKATVGPPAEITPDGALCWDRACVDDIRFADENTGYAFGSWQFQTTDGGRTWQPYSEKQTAVVALEAAGGDVIRVIAADAGCPPGCRFIVQRLGADSTLWKTLATPLVQGVGARLLRHGDDVYVFADQHRAGGAGDAHTQIIVSHDRGTTWTQRADPCSPAAAGNAVDESDAVDAAIGVDGTFVMLCQRRDSATNGGTLRVSTDAAATFGPSLPLSGNANRVAVGSARDILVSASSGSSVQVLRSTNGGRTFTSVLATKGAGTHVDRFLAFTTEQVSTWIDSSGALWRSADGGATWVERSYG